MKKLLSIVICVLFGVSSSWAADVKTSIQIVPSDGGVASVTGVDYNEDGNTKTYGGWSLFGGTWYYYTGYIRNTTNGGTITSPSTETVTSWSENGSWNIDKNKNKFYHNAEADLNVDSVTPGYAFEKWTCNSSTFTGTTFKDATALSTTVDYGEASRTQSGNATITANFRKIITPNQPVIDWTKPAGEEATYPTTVTLFKAKNFKVSGITHNRGGDTRTFTCSPNVGEVIENPGNSITLTFTAGTDVEDGDQFIVTLQADDGASETITINIKSKISVKFVHPTVGKGSFKAVRTNSDKGESCNIGNDDPDVPMELSKTEDFYHTFTAEPADGYRFYRWLVNGNESDALKNNPSGYTLKDGDEITVEFLPKDVAMFIVKGGDGTQYFKLDDAIAAAQNSTSKTVVVANDGSLYTEYKSLTNGKYEFTIPSGITLLVPGDAVNTVITKLDKNSCVEVVPSSEVTPHKTLTLPTNTRINVADGGKICVYAKVTYKNGYNGTPISPGMIDMGENTEINLQSGSILTAYGYIVGANSSKVTALNGANVYELFQFRDWRGGTATAGGLSGGGMIDDEHRVFPFSQYYIQNIETRLILQKGATVSASSVVNMTGAGVIPLTFKMISEDTGDANDEGIFCIGENTQVVRWYDSQNDRQMYKIEPVNPQSKGTAKIGVISTTISTTLSNKTVDSRRYVLPITNNLDITFDGVDVVSKYELGLLPGTRLTIKSNASLTTESSVFIYDKEYLRNPANNIGFCYSQISSTDVPFIPIHYTAKMNRDEVSAKRQEPNIKDAEIMVNGIWNVNDGKISIKTNNWSTKTLDAGIYTTGETNSDKAYGANITSSGGGKIIFGQNTVARKTETYQYQQIKETYVSIPVTTARLRNADGSWSAGENAKNGETYTYVQSLGKWMLPQTLQITNTVGDTFNLTLPNDLPQNVVCDVTGEGITDKNFAVQLPDGTKFTKGTISYANGKLTIPLTYHAQNKHNKDNPYTETMTITCTDPTGKETSTPITLTATEDYTPDFFVTIDKNDVTSNGTYSFKETVYGQSEKASLAITPAANNVAGLPEDVEWSIVSNPNPPFSMAELNSKVVYAPESTASNTGTLTIQAHYSDGSGAKIPSKVVSVTLSGTPRKKDATLNFKDELSTMAIYQADIIENIFENIGNGEDINFEYKYANGTDASELVQIGKNNETGNYTLTAKLTDYVEDRTLIITATQVDGADQFGTTKEVTITIKPLVTWNWSNLHFGKSYTNSPVTLSKLGEWSLELIDAAELVTLSGSAPNYTATVGVGEADAVYIAEFRFTQNDQSKTFTSKIFADPRVLGFCVNYDHQFEGVSTNSTVTFEEKEGDKLATTIFEPGNVWEINMTGIPKTLHFNVTGNNVWYIAERPNASTSYRPIINWTNLTGEQVIPLQPTTNQIMIQYGSADAGNGTVSGLCIDELEVFSDQDVVYFPIYKNGDETSKEVIVTHSAQQIEYTITGNSGFTISSSASTEIPTGDDNEKYYQTTITLKDGEENDAQRVEVGAYTLTVIQGDIELNIPVYADVVPQGLPIRLAEDDIKRYHFIATESSEHVTWNANKEIIFKNAGNVAHSVVLTFEGAPSRISFTASRDIEDTEWKIYESEDGSAGSFVESDASINRDTESGPNFVHNLKYTTRYVRIYYYSENSSELTLSNLVIEGDPMLIVDPEELEYDKEHREKDLTLTAINLNKIRIELSNTTDFQMQHGSSETAAAFTLDESSYPDALGKNKVGNIVINTKWISESIVNDGIITIYNVVENKPDSVLAKIKLVGAGQYLRLEDAATTGIYTGIPDGTRDIDGDGNNDTYTYHGKDYNADNTSPYSYHQVNLTNAFAPDGTALFDYLFVYGETTTTDATKNITAPSGDNGSNALTPYYVYVRDVDAYGKFDRYRFVTMVENINVGTKPHIEGVTISGTEDSEDEENNAITVPVNYIPVDKELSVYITGFAPYATTGFTKGDEGVFFFRGNAGDTLHVYLEDAHIFARNKMEHGQPFYTRGDQRNPTFSEKYARGSGGVLVFECTDTSEQIDLATPFDVTIHTIGNNLLKSNYGCFNYFFGMDPFQISAPIHVRLHSADHVRLSKTTLNFDDIWPTKLDETGQIITSKRTNGFLGLKKLNNNAPSIDLGNPYTTVNFNGGQIQLQNAQIVSTNYKTTLAISYRSGEYGGDKVGLKFAYGIGTDSVGGTVNFNDGTITIEPMWVKEEYKNYYFIDKDANGNEIKKVVRTEVDPNDPSKTIDIYEYQTTCLRCPKNTYVYGGSICWLRACQHVTSKGGAPTGGGGVDVGQYIYTFDPKTDSKDELTQLVTALQFPGDIKKGDDALLEAYFNLCYPKNPLTDKGEYGTKSITPDANKKLYFWIPEGYGNVSAEKDKFLTTWKACMTEISAGAQGLTGTVGGNTAVEKSEEIKYMLYCQIDENISKVITAGRGEGENKEYDYWAPVKVPDVAQKFYGDKYTEVRPTSVGDELQNEVLSEKAYEVTDKVYYITTATADIWHTFTAPFDVANVWVVEAYSEAELKKLAKQATDNDQNARTAVLLAQAEHNADFAAFFGVAMAIGTSDPLETIFNDFKEWGEIQDKKTVDRNGTPREPLYDGSETYTLRDRHKLIPYNGNNWSEANFYLNHNTADWEITDVNEYGDPIFTVHWEIPTVDAEGVLLRKGETYSMLFPYCSGCWKTEEDAEGQMHVVERDFWDYWSGKFLIFESVDYSTRNDKVHVIEGSDYIKEDWTVEELENLNPDGIFISSNMPAEGKAKVTGNSTFAYLNTEREDMLTYYPEANNEAFLYNSGDTIYPTSTFLLAPYIPDNLHGMPARGVMRTGQIIYEQPKDDNNGTTTGGNMPTVGGGNDLFITSIAGGINIAVAAPQYVRVLSSTGALLFSGMVQTSVDVTLPANGVYVIAGENEVQKILY